MAPLLFLLGYLLVAIVIGLGGSTMRHRWLRWTAVVAAASLPGILWLALSVRDAFASGLPVFERVTESGRFGFYVGGMIAIYVTPVWLLAGLVGLWIGESRSRKRVR